MNNPKLFYIPDILSGVRDGMLDVGYTSYQLGVRIGRCVPYAAIVLFVLGVFHLLSGLF